MRRACFPICLLALLVLPAACTRLGAEQGVATSWADDNPLIEAELNALNYYTLPASSVAEALTPGTPVAIITATPAHLTELLANPTVLDAFTRGGGWLMLNGLTPEGLASYDTLVGFPHLLRPFRSEKVGISAQCPEIGRGLQADDVSMRTLLNQWTGDFLVTTDAYGWVVDTDDLAPFVTLPDYTWFHHPDGNIDHNPLNLIDGFGSGDSWKRVLALYPTRSRMDFPMVLPSPQEISGIEVITSFVYPGISHIALTCDGDEGSKVVLATPNPGAVDTAWDKPRMVRTIGVRVVDWQNTGRDVLGIDDIHIWPARDQRFRDGVKPITTNGAIVAYPRANGGILLCELNFAEHDQDLQNIQRRRNILAVFMHTMHVVPGRHVTAGDALPPPPPIALGTPCALGSAAILEAASTDWLDVASAAVPWPHGHSSLGGIAFAFGDRPEVVVRRSGQPAALIPLQQTAQSLVFLHTAATTAATGAVLGAYTVTFADGRTVSIPLVNGLDLADRQQAHPAGLARARLAWLGHVPGESDDRLTVLYEQQWDNPTPAVPITEVHLTCTAPSTTLALFAVTALPFVQDPGAH